jgi:class 3 adenylate cyclase
MFDRLGRLRNRILALGVRESDRPEDRLRKSALVLTAVLITVLATVWTATYLLLGRPVAATVPFAYQAISVVSLVYFARTGDFDRLRLAQLSAMLVLPFLLQWSLGGFVNSSAMMVWAFTSPLGALVLYGPRQAVLFFAGYLGLTVVSGIIDPALAASAAPLPDAVRLLFFVLNLGAVSLVVYAVLQYFVAARERALQATDDLLHNILPMKIADRLKGGEQRIADDHASVSVLFADVAGFTGMARKAGAAEVITVLDRLFTEFDALADRHGLEKIKTIGDAYMAVAGAPDAREDHVRAAANMALEMVPAGSRIAAEVGWPLEIRVGLHTGPAMAGVIGRRKFAYDLWGDAVNVASRMEAHGVPGRIQVSEAVEVALRGDFLFEERGAIEIRGLGEMRTFFLLGRSKEDVV